MRKYGLNKRFWALIGVGILAVVSAVSLLMRGTGLSGDRAAGDGYERAIVEVAGEPFSVEVARTTEEKMKGLSGRTALPEGTGMLFWFDTDGNYPFWMPDMHFPIDIVWIDKDLSIVHIEDRVSPDSFPSLFSSPTPARYVLEVPAGTMEKLGAKIGQKIDISARAP